MKRVLFITIICILPTLGFALETGMYTIDLSIDFGDHDYYIPVNWTEFYHHIDINAIKKNSSTSIYNEDYISNKPYGANQTITHPKPRSISTSNDYSQIQIGLSTSALDREKKATSSNLITLNPSSTTLKLYYDGSFNFWYNLYLYVKIRPTRIALIDKDPPKFLLFDDSLVINVTQGFPLECYPWRYKTDKENSWNKLSNNLIRNNGSTIVIKGSDIFSLNEFKQLVADECKLSLDLLYSNYLYSPKTGLKTISLDLKLTAPRIVHADSTAPTCHGVDNGTITLKLSDRITPDDRLCFNLYRRKSDGLFPPDAIADSIVGQNDSTITISGLAPGTYLVAYSNATSTIYHNYHIFTGSTDSLLNYVNNTYTLPYFDYAFRMNFKRHAVIVTVPEAPEPITATFETQNLSCFESGDGIIRISPHGGTAPYTITVNSDTIQSPFEIGNLRAGDYSISVGDSHNCTPFDTTITLTQPEPLSFTFSHTDSLKCYGDANGQLWLNHLEGGTPPYTVRLDNLDDHSVGFTDFTQGVNEQTILSETLKACTYLLSVSDSNHCFKSSDKFAIKEPGVIKIPSIIVQSPKTACPEDQLGYGSTIAFDGTPPYTYTWKTAAGDMSGSTVNTLPFGAGRVVVCDKNNCCRDKEYYLHGPDTIRANARVIDVKCQGENTGAIELDPTGGTGDIQCRWTDAQGLEVTDLQHLAEGTYFLTMTDGLRCQAFDTAHVGTTSHIRFDHTAIQPSCYSLKDGALEVCARGGVEPYNWDGGCLRLDHIGRGMHPVSVSDAIGCNRDTLIELTAPESITPFLPERVALCINQAGRTLRADTLAYPSATYVWTHDGDVTAEGPVCTVSRPGHYRLHMEYEGCTEDKDFEVQTLGDSIAAYFLIASFVPVDDDVRAVNLSRLPADSTEWLATPNADIIQSDERELLLYFTEKGTAEIGLRTYKGACVAEYFQTVQIVDDDQVAAYDRFGSVVEQFTVSPNPSDGNFNVKVALSRACDYTLTLLSGKTLLQTVDRNDSRGQIDAFQLKAATGVYFIRLDIPEADIRQTRKIIVE